MSRLIDADALIKDLSEEWNVLDELEFANKAVWKVIDAQPTIEEHKKGKWIYKDDLKQFFCSECGYPSLTFDDEYLYGMDKPNFCENCGADMRGEECTKAQ